MPIVKLKRRAMYVNGISIPDMSTFKTDIDSFEAADEALRKFGMAMQRACLATLAAFENAAFCRELPHIAHAWLEAHPGRRLPGGNSNARLRKKRRDYLWRWWWEQG